jgi:hypothetical protein
MPSRTFDITLKDKATGQEHKARTTIVNFDSDDIEAAKAEWAKHNANAELIEMTPAADLSEADQQRVRDMLNRNVQGSVSSPAPLQP